MPMALGAAVGTQQLPAVVHSPGNPLSLSDPDHLDHVDLRLIEWVLMCVLLFFSLCRSPPTLAKQPVSIAHVLVRVSRAVSRHMLAYSYESETDFKNRVAGEFNIRPAEFRLLRAGRPLTIKLLFCDLEEVKVVELAFRLLGGCPMALDHTPLSP